MIDYNGIGLAAPQVHLSKRIIIFINPDIEEKEKIEVTPLINPTFKPLNDEKEDDVTNPRNWNAFLNIFLIVIMGIILLFSSTRSNVYRVTAKTG